MCIKRKSFRGYASIIKEIAAKSKLLQGKGVWIKAQIFVERIVGKKCKSVNKYPQKRKEGEQGKKKKGEKRKEIPKFTKVIHKIHAKTHRGKE